MEQCPKEMIIQQGEPKMTAIQQELWPDEVETDPIKVAAIYNKSSKTYTSQSIEDGWDSTYVMINR